jgi:hypothetical protein
MEKLVEARYVALAEEGDKKLLHTRVTDPVRTYKREIETELLDCALTMIPLPTPTKG